MLNRNKKYLFIVIWSIYLLVSFIKITTIANKIVNWSGISKIISIFCYLFFLFYIAFNKKEKKDFILESILMLVAFLGYLFSDDTKMLYIIVLLILSKYINFKLVSKVSLIELIVLSFLTIILASINIIPNYYFTRTGETIKRYSFGFSYVTQLDSIVLEIIFLIIYLNLGQKRRLKIIYIFSILILDVLANFVTHTKTQEYIGLLMIILCIFNSKLSKNIFYKHITQNIFFIILLISIILSFKYENSNEIFFKLNEYLNYRLSFSNVLVNNYKLTPFGNKINMYGTSTLKYGNATEYFYIDNSYMQILYKFGYVTIIALVFIYYKYSRKLFDKINNEKYLFSIWLTSLSILLFFVDSNLLGIFNIPILGVYGAIYNRDEEKYNE